MQSLKINNFLVKFDEKFTLPYKKQEIFENFNFSLDLPTHRKTNICKRHIIKKIKKQRSVWFDLFFYFV